MLTREGNNIAFLSGGGEMGKLMRSKDWSLTPLGSPETWPQCLQISISILLNSQFPMFVWWGEDYLTFYNDAYRVILADKHPKALGASGPIVWSEIWDVVGPMAYRVRVEGRSNWAEDQLLYINRHGFVEETYFTFSYSPVLDLDGHIGGVFCACTETTEKVFAIKELKESEARFRQLADESPMFVFILEADPVAPVSFWNKTWLQYTGQTQEEAVGRAWDGIIYSEDVPVVMEHYSPAFEKKEPYFIPAVRVRRHDGAYRWHLFKGSPRYAATGQFNGYIGVGFDVHEQKLAQEALKQSEQKLRSMIMQAPVAMCILKGKDHVVEIANDSMLQIWGKKREEVIGRPTFEANPEGKGQGFEEILETIYHTSKPYHINEIPLTLLRWGKEELFYINLSYDPIIEADGTVSGILVVGIEVTQQVLARRKTEEVVKDRTNELEKANEELKRSNTNLEEFAYAASHDMKEPIRKIHFFSDRIKQRLGNRLEGEDRRYFERLEAGTKRMSTLIDDLLLYSHVNRGKSSVEAVDLNQMLSFVLDDLELHIEEKGARVEIGPLPILQGRPRQLQQLFENLIANALKYSKEGVAPVVSISSRQIKGAEAGVHATVVNKDMMYYLIEVKDNGIGFEQADAERIFNVFIRLHGNAQYRGTGVGLSIVQKIVENHSGYIWAESRPGEGATFKMLLPAG
jgi:PAS domain S-box-containing protein